MQHRPQRRHARRTLPFLIAVAFAAASCSGSSDGDSTVPATTGLPTTTVDTVATTTTEPPASSPWQVTATVDDPLPAFVFDVRCSNDTIAVSGEGSTDGEFLVTWSTDDGRTWAVERFNADVPLMFVDEADVVVIEQAEESAMLTSVSRGVLGGDGTYAVTVPELAGLAGDGTLPTESGVFVTSEITGIERLSDGTFAARGNGFWSVDNSVGELTAFGATSSDGEQWEVHPLPDTGQRSSARGVLDGPAGPLLAVHSEDQGGTLSLHRLDDPATVVHQVIIGQGVYSVHTVDGDASYTAVVDEELQTPRRRTVVSSADGTAWSESPLVTSEITEGVTDDLLLTSVDGSLAALLTGIVDGQPAPILAVLEAGGWQVEPVDAPQSFVEGACQRPDGSIVVLANSQGTLSVLVREAR